MDQFVATDASFRRSTATSPAPNTPGTLHVLKAFLALCCCGGCVAVSFLCMAVSPSTGVATRIFHDAANDGLHLGMKSGCARTCPTHVAHSNILVYRHNDEAGLNHWESVVRRLLDISGYLCATLHIPRPVDWFAVMHNHGELVDSGSTWSDFWNLRLLQNEPVTLHEFSLLEVDSYVHSLVMDPANNVSMKLHSEQSSDVASHFLDLKRFVEGQNRDPTHQRIFLWEIDANFYKWRAELNATLHRQISSSDRHALPFHCQYTQADASTSLIRSIASSVWERIRGASDLTVNGTIYGTFHVRRNDNVRKCDTTLHRMREFLSCSFDGTSSSAALGNITVLFQSDESNRRYRDGIRDLLMGLEGHVRYVDLDQYVAEEIKRRVQLHPELSGRVTNNYFVYAVEKFVQNSGHLSFRLRQDRKSCQSCTPLLGKLSQVSQGGSSGKI